MRGSVWCSLFPLVLVYFSVPGSAQERSPIYPFDVKIAGQQAELQGNTSTALFAKTPKPVRNDAVVELAGDPGLVIVNVFPCDEKGAISQKNSSNPKVIMAQKAAKFQLDQTMDKSKLGPGFYLMNIVVQPLGTSRVVFEIGNAADTAPPPKKAGIDRSKPESVLQAVFDCAKSGELAKLKILQSSGADGDVKRVCSVSGAPANVQADFRKHFSTGKISGAARIEGNKAQVDFLFGPDGTKKETMNLVKEAGGWFLDSF